MDEAPDIAKIKGDVEKALFDDAFLKAYAIVDGARCLQLLGKFDEMQPPFECLYLGELDPEVEVVAPYLVELKDDENFFDWLLDEGWGDSWCIYLTSERSILDLRAHFRKLTIVEMPDGQFVYFRFYDPRVLRSFLPTCDDQQIKQVYGDVVEKFHLEAPEGAEVLTFTP